MRNVHRTILTLFLGKSKKEMREWNKNKPARILHGSTNNIDNNARVKINRKTEHKKQTIEFACVKLDMHFLY